MRNEQEAKLSLR